MVGINPKISTNKDVEIAEEIDINNFISSTNNIAIERSTAGIFGIFFAILSLIVASLILAPISIIIGYIAYRKGDVFGLWSIVIGAFSLLGTILVLKFI